MATINLGRVKGDKGDRGETGLINGATQVQVHPTTKVMYNGASIPANTAASRLVGTASGNLAEYSNDFGLSGGGYMGEPKLFISQNNLANMQTDFAGCFFFRGHAFSDIFGLGNNGWATGINIGRSGQNDAITIGFATKTSSLYVSHCRNNSYTHHKLYSDKNTTIESGTNYLKVASPILRLQHDDFVKEHEAEKMDITVENQSVGVYKVTGTTGLRSDGTWHFSPPKDEHNNVLCMVEVSEQDGVITVNTYKKKFDFETISIVPDYEQPTNIPDGATVMLRFNDLPQDGLDEPTA